MDRMREWARALKCDVHAIYLAARDPRTPWYVKALALAVAGYALSPIDLVPDFIPGLGYLDDVILLPLGIWLVVRLMPPELMAKHRELAAAAGQRPMSKAAAVAIIAIWVVAVGVSGGLLAGYLRMSPFATEMH